MLGVCASLQAQQPVTQGPAAVVGSGWPVTSGTLAEVTAAWTNATAGNTTLRETVTGYGTVEVFLNQTTTVTGGVITFEASDTTAFTNAYPITCAYANSFTSASTYTLVASTNQAFECEVSGFNAFQVRLSTVMTGTGAINVGMVAKAMPSNPDVTVGGTVGVQGRAGTSLESTAGVLDNNLKNVNNAAVSTAASGVQKVGIVGNAGATLDGAPGSAVPTNAQLIAGTDGTNTRVPYMDPCAYNAWTYYVVNVSANTQIATTAGAAKNYYICQMVILPTPAAANVNLVSSTTAGNACATSPSGMLGGATAALGANLSINGGFVLPASGRAWTPTVAANSAFCIFTSAQVSGVIAYVGPI